MTDARQADAYELLSRPTLQLSDDEVQLIITDLRSKRIAYLSGKKDTTVAKAKEARIKPTEAQKKAATADLLAQLKL